MNFIRINLRRMRRKNRIPSRLLAAVSSALLLLVLTASLLALPASAKNGMRMPRTEDGIVSDDGAVSSGDAITDVIPDIGDAITDGVQDILPDGTDGTTTAGETSAVTTTPATTNNAGNEMADDVAENNMLAWIIGLIVLAGVVIAIVLIIRWASGSRREH